MLIHTLVLGRFQENCYLLLDDKTRAAVIIDPGFDFERIRNKLDQYHLRYILLTHAHIDHLGAVADLQACCQAEVVMDAADLPLLNTIGIQAARFGMAAPPSFKVDHYAHDGDTFSFGEHVIQALATPGHSPGGLSFLVNKHVFTGDVLFYDAIGRTDLPGSSQKVLLSSIRSKLFTLPDDVQVYPGHGSTTTIGREKRYNPFF